MQLLLRKAFYQTIYLLVVFAIGGLGFFWALNWIIEDNIEEVLLLRKHFITQELKEVGSLSELKGHHDFGHIYHVEEFEKPLTQTEDVLKDTTIYDALEQKELHFRQLSFVINSSCDPQKRSWL